MNCQYLAFAKHNGLDAGPKTVMKFLRHVGMPLESQTMKMALLCELNELELAAVMVTELEGRGIVVDVDFIYDVTTAIVSIRGV